MHKKNIIFLFFFYLFLSKNKVAQTKISMEKNPDGTFKGIYTVNFSPEINIKMQKNPDGSFKGIYIKYIDGKVNADTIVSITDKNAMIRYNPSTDTWQWTTDGNTWYNFGSGGSGKDEKVKADENDLTAGYLIDKVQGSIQVDTETHKLQLVNDLDSPGNSKYYGTNQEGTKGWHDLPIGGGTFDYKQSFSQYSNKNLSSGGTFYSDEIVVDTAILPNITNIYLMSSASNPESQIYYELHTYGIGNTRGFWKFEQNFIDTSGNQPPLTPVNNPTFHPGYSGYAVYFSAANGSHAYLPANQQNNLYLTGSFSVGFWMKQPNWIAHNAILISRERVNPRHGWVVLWNSWGEVVMEYWVNNSSMGLSTSITLNEWQHIVFVVDTAVRKIKCYKNGSKVSEVDFTSTYPQFDDDLYFGNAKYWSGHNWTGYLDEVFIIEKALSDSEVLEIYQNGIRLPQKITSLNIGSNNVSIINDKTYTLKVSSTNKLNFRGFTMFLK